ncbi:recombinase family protein [Streptomyces luteolus]|uniref:Recombinase family protein n=1 Tax=Streptomyces luteolus TaxID=3043615 RepID=A0ABT6SRD1_9ACTN|nr:recombinase family protein [Streptomyces sp. B-S-A12]MDI3417920.1 recombinase family protein [Streptomyces sp. B-S-A12]
MRAYGHENDGVTKVPHEAEYLVAAARKLLEEEGATLGGVAEWMTESAGPTVSGRPWSPTTLRRRLRNPAIAGLRRNTEGELVEGPAEPLIPRELFEAIDRHFRQNERGQVPQHVYLLSGGTAQCDLCESPLVSRSTSKGARGYMCEAEGCGKIWISAPPLDEYVAERMLAKLSRPNTLQKLAAARDRIVSAAEGASRQLGELDLRRKELAEQLGAASLRMLDYQTAVKSLEGKRKAALAVQRRSKYLGELPELTQEGLTEWWHHTAGDEQRRALLQLVVERVRVEPATKRGSNKFDEQRFNIVYR